MGGKALVGLAAGAGRDDIVDGLLQLHAGALNALEIIAKGAGNGLFDRVGFWWHTCFEGFLPQFPRFAILGGRERGVNARWLWVCLKG